jgi:two-component system sporulation sensor kinase A
MKNEVDERSVIEKFSSESVYEGIKTFQTFMKYCTDLLSRHNSKSKFTYVSPASMLLIGYDQDELIGQTLTNLCHPEDESIIMNTFTNINHCIGEKITYRVRRKEGDYIWLETTICGNVMEDQTNEYNSDDEILCISRDITSQKLAEEEMKESEEKYRLLVEHSQDIIGVITNEGCWIYINKEGKKLFGTTSVNEIIGKAVYDFIHPEDRLLLKDLIDQLREGKRKTIEVQELRLVRSDHQETQIEIKLIPTIYKGRKTQQVVIRDITERKKTEEKLQQAEKLSVVGQLAAGIAHEIRNPLTAIKGFSQLMKNSNDDNFITVILSELDRIENIVSDLLVLAKPQAVNEIQETDLNELILSVITLLNTEAILHSIEIKKDIPHGALKVECEVDKIKQVLINIIKNAIEAMKTGGEIAVQAVVLPNNEIKLSITDQGNGIPEDRLPKLGEPFYSTKEKGTGLGLMICNKIIKNHKGKMNISSKVNEGTIVDIILPRTCKEIRSPQN